MESLSDGQWAPVGASTEARENDVKASAEIVLLMMRDQGTHTSYGTFCAWMLDLHPTLSWFGLRSCWAHALAVQGALTEHEQAHLWVHVAQLRQVGQRRGQALMNALPREWCEHLTGTWGDCFNNDDAIGRACQMLGITVREVA